jgi:uncharacterized SAM-binding protein YcdF (DUF218 family)
MEQICAILKSLVDPVFIIFTLLFISFFIWLISTKKKSDTLLLFFTMVLLYGFSTFPVSNYLAYQLEKDYMQKPAEQDKINLDVIVVLSGGAYDINALNRSYPGDATTVRLVHAVQMYKKYTAKYFVCSGKGQAKISNAQVMAQMAVALDVPGIRFVLKPNPITRMNTLWSSTKCSLIKISGSVWSLPLII